MGRIFNKKTTLSFRPINNQSGYVGILLSITVMAAALATSLNFSSKVEQMNKMTVSSKNTEQLKDVNTQLKIILQRASLCASLLRVTGNSFKIENIFELGVKLKNNLEISALDVANIVSLGGNAYTADFILKAKSPTDTRNERVTMVQASYTLNGDVASQCSVLSDPKIACESFGAEWIQDQNRCDVCSIMGGVWNTETSKCDL